MRRLMTASCILVLAAVAASGAPNYNLGWYSVCGGADNAATSASYRSELTVGEAAGEAESPSFKIGFGFAYGTQGCQCPYQSDFDEDSFLTSLDLGEMIDVLFAGSPDIQDPDCPNPRADFDCDGFSTSLDLADLIDHLFAGEDGPCDPCGL